MEITIDAPTLILVIVGVILLIALILLLGGSAAMGGMAMMAGMMSTPVGWVLLLIILALGGLLAYAAFSGA